MSEDRKKPGVAFWATVVVVGLALYVLSIGPAAWIVEDSKPGDCGWGIYHAAYYPLLQIRDLDEEDLGEEVDGRGPFSRAIDLYLSLWGGGPRAYIDT
jgi:hypothetical protein